MKKNESQNEIRIAEITEAWAETHRLECEYIPEIDSTNDLAKEEAFDSEQPVKIYLADKQTAGRGRFDRKWENAKIGSTLLSSWSFQIQKAPQPLITPVIGLALYHAARATWPFLNWQLKAPNDLYIADKKVAGLLVETVSQGAKFRLIVGLGLNVFAHPEEVDFSSDIFSELQNIKQTEGIAPLLGQDWIRFLDRWLFEICQVIPESGDDIDYTTQQSLLSIFNQNPMQKTKFKSFTELKEELWRLL